ncbi:MAG: M20 family metallopeptidase [Acidobacteria bacterium]|nr:M20 family metallopeptidase [Acidobacteriota bacterium]
MLRYFVGRQAEVLALTRELVEQESPSGDAEGSRAVVSILERAARAVKSVDSFERIPAPNDYGEHLRLRAFGGGAKVARSTLIVGHTDTVHPRGTLRQRPWREDGGRLYGPGIYDMKASCALALETLRACAELSLAPQRPVVLLLTCDEEEGSMSGRALVEEESRRAEQVLVLEPPARDGSVKTERKGTGHFVLSVEGRAAHAGLEPEKGVSAVLEIARQIERLHALNDYASGTTVNVGLLSGGTASNVVAAQACAEIDVRFKTMEQAERINSAILNLRPFDERARLSVEGGINRPPMERTEAVVNLYTKARGIAAALDFELGEASVGGASDGNFAAACGVAVLDGLGVEGDGAHAAHEHIIAGSIIRRGALLAALVATL